MFKRKYFCFHCWALIIGAFACNDNKPPLGFVILPTMELFRFKEESLASLITSPFKIVFVKLSP